MDYSGHSKVQKKTKRNRRRFKNTLYLKYWVNERLNGIGESKRPGKTIKNFLILLIQVK